MKTEKVNKIGQSVVLTMLYIMIVVILGMLMEAVMTIAKCFAYGTIIVEICGFCLLFWWIYSRFK